MLDVDAVDKRIQVVLLVLDAEYAEPCMLHVTVM